VIVLTLAAITVMAILVTTGGWTRLPTCTKQRWRISMRRGSV